MTTLPQKLEIGQRWAHWLHNAYPKDAAKLIARDFEVSISTSTRWLGGVIPTFEHFTVAAKRWGRPFIAFVFGKLPTMSEAEIMDRLSAAERSAEAALQQIKEIRNEAMVSGGASLAGDGPGALVEPAVRMGSSLQNVRAAQ